MRAEFYGNDAAVCQSYNVLNATHYEWDDVQTIAMAHVIGSTFSIACCVAVILLTRVYPSTARFPSNMLVYKTVCDFLSSVIVLGINLSILRHVDTHLEHGSQLCENGLLAGLSAFLLLASPGWFFALAYNLNRSLHDPFTKPQSRMSKFHMGVWGVAAASSVFIGSLAEYRPNLHMCWSCHGLPEALNWLLFFGWIAAYWLFATYFMADAWYWLVYSRRGVAERISSRSTQLRSSMVYVAIIGGQWVLAGTTFVLIFEPHRKFERLESPPNQAVFRILFAIVVGLLGATDLISWLATSLPVLKERAMLRRRMEILGTRPLGGDSGAVHLTVGSGGSSSEPAGKHALVRASMNEDDMVPVWYGKNQLKAGTEKVKRKKLKQKAKEDIGDVSEALRREFVQYAVAGVVLSLRRATMGLSSRKAEELLHDRVHSAAADVQRPKSARGLSRAQHGPSSADSGGQDIEMQPSPSAKLGGGRCYSAQLGGEGAARELLGGKQAAASSSGGGDGSGGGGYQSAASREPPEQVPASAFADEQQTELPPGRVYFRDLAPRVFMQLRTRVFDLDDDGYIEGLMGEGASGSRATLSATAAVDKMVLSFSEGKGGGFFFWSIDRRFMVKTLEPDEYKKLKELLPSYYQHMLKRRRSLLPRFYGAYSITIQKCEKHFVVMESVFRHAPDMKVHQCYDLKGSWVDRRSGIAAMQSGIGTLKDMDLIQPLKIARSDAEAVLEELRHDSELLRSANLMDYSLLLGVHNQRVHTETLDVRRSAEAVVSNAIDVPEYYMGVIDIFQAWNLQKRLERLAKTVLKGRFKRTVRDGMSAVEPNLYRNRFLAGIGYQLGLD